MVFNKKMGWYNMNCKMMLSKNENVISSFEWEVSVPFKQGKSELCITDSNVVYTCWDGKNHSKLNISEIRYIAAMVTSDDECIIYINSSPSSEHMKIKFSNSDFEMFEIVCSKLYALI